MLAGLWLLIFGFLFLVLVFKTALNLRAYSETRKIVHLKKVAALWLVPISFVAGILFLSWFLSLTRVDKNKIIGSYEVDTRFYPGKTLLGKSSIIGLLFEKIIYLFCSSALRTAQKSRIQVILRGQMRPQKSGLYQCKIAIISYPVIQCSIERNLAFTTYSEPRSLVICFLER